MSFNNVSPSTPQKQLVKDTGEKYSTDFKPSIVTIPQITTVPFRMKGESSVNLDNMQLYNNFLA